MINTDRGKTKRVHVFICFVLPPALLIMLPLCPCMQTRVTCLVLYGDDHVLSKPPCVTFFFFLFSVLGGKCDSQFIALLTPIRLLVLLVEEIEVFLLCIISMQEDKLFHLITVALKLNFSLFKMCKHPFNVSVISSVNYFLCLVAEHVPS